jgi:hypothetical protein
MDETGRYRPYPSSAQTVRMDQVCLLGQTGNLYTGTQVMNEVRTGRDRYGV